jgi:hypothetical protein
MGLLSSRNGRSEGWFTLQDEPVHDPIGGSYPSDSRPTRGRGLVKLVEPPARPLPGSPSETSAAIAGVKGARFTRASRLERWNARAVSVMGTSRFGALALIAVIVMLTVAVLGLLAARGGSDHAAIQAYKMQIARLTTERDRAAGAAAQAGQANAAAQTQLERWRSLAVAEQRAARVGRPRARGNNRRGGGR